MNNYLIEKVIKSNSNTCPSFNFSSPLLDHNVARALSKSFVKILGVSGQNSNINNSLRLSVLEKIRRMCQVEAENHLNVDENMTEVLTNFYRKHIEDTASAATNSTDKLLDTFLLKTVTEIEVNPKFPTTANPEVLQALTNLKTSEYHESLSKDVLNWNTQDPKCLVVLKNLWENTIPQSNIIDDFSIKLKSEFETILLHFTVYALTNRNIDVKHAIVNHDSMLNLINTCQSSPQCYQTCINILNFLFMRTNFDCRMLKIIETFVESVKDSCTHGISQLYPVMLTNLVVLMDIEINELPAKIKSHYIKVVIKHLHDLHKYSESDLILLVSHFPQWFDVYFEE